MDGQIVVDQATLTVQAQPEDRQRAVVEDPKQLNSHTYAVGRASSERWQEQETENFFRVHPFGKKRSKISCLARSTGSLS